MYLVEKDETLTGQLSVIGVPRYLWNFPPTQV